MNLHTVLFLGLLLLSPSANAQVAPAAPDFKPAVCAATENPIWLVLKESFRNYPERRDGTHQFLLVVGCSSQASETSCSSSSLPCQNSAYRLTGQVYFGKEADSNYRSQVPTPLNGTVFSRSFAGTFHDLKMASHGSMTALRSDDGEVSADGDFYSNRNISFSVDGKIVPASLIP